MGGEGRRQLEVPRSGVETGLDIVTLLGVLVSALYTAWTWDMVILRRHEATPGPIAYTALLLFSVGVSAAR
ncbi:MAG: hypothetical protein Kow00122_13160 [Thermoleophilia bacterium]